MRRLIETFRHITHILCGRPNGIIGPVVGDFLQQLLGHAVHGYFVFIATAGAFCKDTLPNFLGLRDIVHQGPSPNAHTAHILRHGHGKRGAAVLAIANDGDGEITAFDFFDSHKNLHPFKGSINLAQQNALPNYILTQLA